MEITTGEILGEAKRLVAASWVVSLIYVVVSAGLQTIADQPEWARGGQLAASIAGAVLGYALVTKMVEKGFGSGSLAGFWSYVGLSVLMAIALTLAAIALIIPAIYLAVRWTASYAFLCVEGQSVSQSLSSSYELTRDAFWPILLALSVPFAIWIGGVFAVAAWAPEVGPPPLWLSVPGNLAVSAASVLMTGIGLAVYSLRRHPSAQLDAVFA